MTVHDRLITATRRIASLSSITRNRAYEAERLERRGEVCLSRRLEVVASRFERLADDMEKDLS